MITAKMVAATVENSTVRLNYYKHDANIFVEINGMSCTFSLLGNGPKPNIDDTIKALKEAVAEL